MFIEYVVIMTYKKVLYDKLELNHPTFTWKMTYKKKKQLLLNWCVFLFIMESEYPTSKDIQETQIQLLRTGALSNYTTC